jgi:tetratricopeptide (TPR) repeat protein
MKYCEVKVSSLRGAVAVLFLTLACPGFGQAQDAPQPQPAPGLTQQKPVTAPSKAQQPASPTANSNPQSETQTIPAAAERHFRQGVQFERDGNIENAIEEYKAAIKEYPNYFKAHANLGRIYLDRKGYADVHNNLGLALKRDGDIKGAIAQYQEAVRLNPKMADAQNNLANILYKERDLRGAIQHYRAALALQPNSAGIHMNLGSALDDSGDADGAMTEYKEAIRLDPKNSTAHYNLAILYLKKKDNANAVAELRQAAKLSPDWPTPHIMLTNLLKDSDPKAAYSECVVADGLTNDAKLHNLCSDLQRKMQQSSN